MSTNITKQKRDELVSKINQIREFLTQSSDENASRLLGFLGELENDVTNKHYGLIFEEHRESIDEKLESSLPVLTEDKSLEIDNGGLQNFLIEGDNLASLKLLEKTHRGKIDVIYIDPPYNTGNKDFIYDDCFIDSTDTFRHSKWCSFMKKRLEIARKLLSEKGVIFISIDDNEQAALKLLCDGIFGEGNFVANLVWTNNEGGGSSDSKFFKIKHEYILCYSKKIENTEEIKNVDIEDLDRYKLSDEHESERGKYQLVKLSSASIQYSQSLDYPIKCPDGTEIFPADNSDKEKSSWRWGKTKLQWGIENDFIVFKKDKFGIWQIYTKQYTNCDKDGNIVKRTKKPLGIIDKYSSTQGSNLLFKIMNKKTFAYPKPLELIEWLVDRFTSPSQASALAVPNPRGNSSITILDFFAGSGTTGHAVMKLNATDNGKRKFILCTNNQNNICRDITYERLKRVIEKENYSASLKYFRVDFVDITDKLYYEYADKLLKHTRELVELENAINFNKNSKIAICLTEEELDLFCNSKKKINAVEKIYLGHEVQTTAEQEDLFNSKQIEIVRIPNYYYSDVE